MKENKGIEWQEYNQEIEKLKGKIGEQKTGF